LIYTNQIIDINRGRGQGHTIQMTIHIQYLITPIDNYQFGLFDNKQ